MLMKGGTMRGTILVTGASRGLGTEICGALQLKGWQVVGMSRSSAEGVDYPQRKLDLSLAPEDFSKMLGERVPLEEPICGLVHNAAVGYDDLTTNLDAGRLEDLYRVNVINPLLLSRAVIRNFLYHRCGGNLVWIGSVAARLGFKGLAAYGGSKAALEGISRGIAREWGRKGIRSNVISCGFMETAMTASLDRETKERIAGRTALGRLSETAEVAGMVAYLFEPEAAGVTGAVLPVDSGA